MSFPRPFLARALNTHDTNACLAAINSLPLINIERAREKLSALLTGMRHQPPPVAGYLKVLESMRTPLGFIQRELASHYAGKPLPPSDAEQTVFAVVVGLWQQVAQGYVHIAQLGGQPQHMALICQRCVYYAGQVLIEYFRARRAIAPGVWSELNAYYQTAEEWGFANVKVSDPVADETGEPSARTTTCASTYARLLLLDLIDPYGCVTRELFRMLDWLDDLAPLIKIAPCGSTDNPPDYVVDLMRDHGLRPFADLAAAESVRGFDTARLASHLQETLEQLKQRVPPVELGLGENCRASTANRLLRRIRRHLAANPRQFVRAMAGGSLKICSGFQTVHALVKGTGSGTSRHSDVISQNDMDRLSTFRDQLEPIEPLQMSQPDQAAERWEICDQSLNGFRLLRNPAGSRIGPSELLGIKAPGAEFFRLAKVIWLKLEADGRIRAGLRLIPSRPHAVLIRSADGESHSSAKYVRAFLLPSVPALGQRSSLVLPVGWFHHERMIEIRAEQPFKARLVRRLERGADFEQAVFAETSA